MLKRIKKRPILIFTTIFFILFLISSICLIYSILRVSNIENVLRYMISALLIILNLYFLLGTIKIIHKGKNAAIIAYSIIFVILFAAFSYITITVTGLYNSISNLHKNDITYSASLISLSSNKVEIKDIKNKKIAVINKDNNIDLYEVSNNIIDAYDFTNSNEIIFYDTTTDIIKNLYNKEADLAILPSNYVSMFSTIDDYKEISDDTYEIVKKEKSIKKAATNSNKSEKDPITILILGIDSTIKDISTVTSFNADTIMLVTFNPNTYNATIVSIPRDTYVPISCNNNLESKITHSGWNGEACVISTIQNWTGINIDYYVKVNFTAVVNLVDEIGGIEINVPYDFCEQDSQRRWKEHTVYVEKGLQNLNGEQALALARNRHPNPQCGTKWANYYSSDLVRGENQQMILNALVNKLVKSFSLDKMYSILDIIGTNVDTNMQINDMTSYYNLLKKTFDKDTKLNFQRLQLSTYGKNLYDPLLNMAGMSMQIYYNESLNQIVNEMKTNLQLQEPNIIKTFDFSANKPYVETTIGKGIFNQNDIETVPNFIGKTLNEAQTWANNYAINLIYEYQDTTEKANDTIISQSIPSTYRIDKINKNNTFKIIIAKNETPIQIEENQEEITANE